MEEKYHPILNRPWEYSIQEIRWGAFENEAEDHFLDVTFCKNDTVRRLRFVKPQEIKLELSFFPQGCGDMVILDLRQNGLENINVQVAEGGASGSPIILYAKDVIDLNCGLTNHSTGPGKLS